MTKQETYDYLTEHGVSYETTEHAAVYNMEELDAVLFEDSVFLTEELDAVLLDETIFRTDELDLA